MSASDDFLRDLRELLAPIEHVQDISYTDTDTTTNIEISISFATKKTIAIDIYYTNLDAADGTIELQQRAGDGDRWTTISGSSQTLESGADKINTFNIANFGGKFLRIKYTPVSVTSGTLEKMFVMAKPA